MTEEPEAKTVDPDSSDGSDDSDEDDSETRDGFFTTGAAGGTSGQPVDSGSRGYGTVR